MTFANHDCRYEGNLQERLRLLSTRTNYPTRQENGQRYLGPPLDWNGKAPVNAEVFVSRLPADCFEDEIYDFCSRVGKIYLLRLMINFENENRGFCFVTYSSANEAMAAVNLLPQKQLRKGLFVHAEISLNNCTLKMYGLDFRWKDELLEQEIRATAKDVVNVLIRRNMSQRTLMASLQFDTHQKAAIARRKLSQIANSRWGHNVKVFLWSKKLQDRNSNKQTSNPSHHETRYAARACTSQFYERNIDSKNFKTESEKFDTPSFDLWLKSSPGSRSDCSSSVMRSPVTSERSNGGNRPSFSSDEMSALSYDMNNNILNDPFTFPSLAQPSDFKLKSSSTPCSSKSASPFRSSSENDSFRNSTKHRGLCEFDPYENWNTDMFPKPEASTLNLQLPFELDCANRYASEIQNHDKNIELILLEALEALAQNKLE